MGQSLMKVVQVNNFHRILGGSDVVVYATINILKRRGIDIFCLTRDSQKLGIGFEGKLRAFFCGIYSSSACQEMKEIIRDNSPDVVQVHELYPFISPWILEICHDLNIPVILSCHNYRISCPTAHFSNKGKICEICNNGREYWCILKNCRDNLFESISFAIRNIIARKLRLFSNVTLFIAMSNFIKEKLLEAGVPKGRIAVLPNMVSIPDQATDAALGKYFAYVGRLSPEKGIDTLFASTRQTRLPVRLAGDYSSMPHLLENVPGNIIFKGFLGRNELHSFYQNARCVILPSKCYEVNPLVICEAMSYGLPVIASRIGGIPELVKDGETGLLFEPGDSKDLANKMKILWQNPDLCRQMGQAGREKAIREYTEEVYIKRLLDIYMRAIQICRDVQIVN